MDAGFDVNAQDNQGRTALYILGRSFDHYVVKEILERKPDVSIKDVHDKTSLHVACSQLLHLPMHPNVEDVGQLKSKLVQALLEAGSDANAVDLAGNTPLHEVTASNYAARRVFQSLIEHGADIAAKNHQGVTPLHEVAMNPSKSPYSYKSQPCGPGWYQHSQQNLVDLLRLCDISKIDVNARDTRCITPLHLACKTSEYHASILLEFGADVSMKDLDNRTALHYAARGRKSSG
ncbi:MAG: hypothetical protein M1830_008960 [Pleopsidium flavum]|nr:MAG: hypothetical protein M1830_008960 [Pleopsidium flavum]